MVTYGAYFLGALFVGIMPFWEAHSWTLLCPYCGKAFYKEFRWGYPTVCTSCGRERPSVW